MQLAALIGTLTAPFLYAWIGGYAMSLGGVAAFCGLAYAAPILHKEWARIVASGEMLSAKEADALATAETVGRPDDELFTVR